MAKSIAKKNYVRFNRGMYQAWKRTSGWHRYYESAGSFDDDSWHRSPAYEHELRVFDKLTDKVPDDAGDAYQPQFNYRKDTCASSFLDNSEE